MHFVKTGMPFFYLSCFAVQIPPTVLQSDFSIRCLTQIRYTLQVSKTMPFCPFISDPNSGDEHHTYFEKNVTAIEHLAPMIVRPIRRKEYPGHIEEREKVLSDFEFTLPDSDE